MRSFSSIYISGGALILGSDRELLMVRQRPSVGGIWQGAWIFPGGGIRVGERLEEAVHREVWEETGLKIELLRQLWPLERIQPMVGSRCLHVIYLTFLARSLGGEPFPGDDVGEVRWTALCDLPSVRSEIHEDAWLLTEMAGLVPSDGGPRFMPR